MRTKIFVDFFSSTAKVSISHSSALKLDWIMESWLLAMVLMKARTSSLSRIGTALLSGYCNCYSLMFQLGSKLGNGWFL